MDVKAAPNGVATIEDRILRITGYYGYYPGYASQKSASQSSVVRCKPGANCPGAQRGIRRQLSPFSAVEDSAAPILELQSRSPSGFCRHGRGERQNRSGEEGTQGHGESASQESRPQTRCESCTSTFLKIVWGFLIILSVSSSWVGTTQIVKITYKNFDYPFFMTWFSTNWNIMFFPVYYSGHLATAQEKQSPIKKFRECSRIFGEDGLTLKLFLKRTAPFSILWTLSNYLYLLALKKLTATDVSALFCCNKAFVFLLSWIVLKDRFMGIVAAIMAITGIVMMAYADGVHGDSIIGVAYAVGSASTSALYKVLFKMFLGSANFGEAAHFISTLGFFNLIFLSFTPIILYFTKVEYWSPFSAVPWGYLCGIAGLWLAFNILVNVGVVLTYPILISIGTVLSVPGNAAVDLLKREVIFSVVRLGATIIICLGFLLLLLPEEWDEITLRFINSLKEKKSDDHVEDMAESSVHFRSRSRANGPVSIPLA
ncbi:solute carrier family 35 member F4 isoform X2 [Anolis carolinensis]|uniref:solute carrier family 35 member F4 isoform X2 n=1 Tax=Anolis carolinensis TaxID=28377 RepID=UPI002F2B5206